MNDEYQTTINQRLSILVDELEKGSKASFANKIGVAVQSIHDLIGGRKGMPSFKVVSSILEQYPTVDANWLVMGQGHMLREQSLNLSPSINELVQLTQEYIRASKRLDKAKDLYKEYNSILSSLKDALKANEDMLISQNERFKLISKEEQKPMLAIIKEQQKRIDNMQDKYNSFASIHARAEAELIKAHEQYAKIEAQINEMYSIKKDDI